MNGSGWVGGGVPVIKFCNKHSSGRGGSAFRKCRNPADGKSAAAPARKSPHARNSLVVMLNFELGRETNPRRARPPMVIHAAIVHPAPSLSPIVDFFRSVTRANRARAVFMIYFGAG